MEDKDIILPDSLKDHLGPYGACFFDSWCGEPVAWGHKVLDHLGEDLWSLAGTIGTLECSHGSYSSNWYLIVKRLTSEEAVVKYGAVTNLELGPRGGFKSVTYGDKKFSSNCVDPRNNS